MTPSRLNEIKSRSAKGLVDSILLDEAIVAIELHQADSENLLSVCSKYAAWNFEIAGTVHVVSADRDDIVKRVDSYNGFCQEGNQPMATIVPANDFAEAVLKHEQLVKGVK